MRNSSNSSYVIVDVFRWVSRKLATTNRASPAVGCMSNRSAIILSRSLKILWRNKYALVADKKWCMSGPFWWKESDAVGFPENFCNSSPCKTVTLLNAGGAGGGTVGGAIGLRSCCG